MDEVTVRLGVAADFEEMMRLAVAATEENAFVVPDLAMLANQVWASLTMQRGAVGVIGNKVGGPLEGAILLNIGPVWYSAEPVLEEKAIYVDPEFRAAKGGRARGVRIQAEHTVHRAREVDVARTGGKGRVRPEDHCSIQINRLTSGCNAAVERYSP